MNQGGNVYMREIFGVGSLRKGKETVLMWAAPQLSL
jgi:hypothetical protein